jgi:hypothetical protein
VGIICCTEPGLTEALYILYMSVISSKTCKMYITVHTDNWLITADRLLTKDRPTLSSERAPPKDKTEIVKQ